MYKKKKVSLWLKSTHSGHNTKKNLTPPKKWHLGMGGGGVGGVKIENSMGDNFVSQNDDFTRG